MTELRSSDELEGTLLPPLRRSRTDPSTTALPMNYFDYSQNSQYTEDDDSLGPVMLSFDSGTTDAVAREVTNKARYGTDKGRIAASEEKDSIRAANRKVAAYGFHEAQRIEMAKKIAKQRHREGFNVRFFRTKSINGNEKSQRNSENVKGIM